MPKPIKKQKATVMIRNYTLLFLLFLGIVPALAKQRTRQEIQAIAQRLIATSNDSHYAKVASKDRDDSRGELKEVAATANYTVMAYDRGGFAIISNDDANSPVIGYSQTSLFSIANPALAWYLNIANATLSNKDFYTIKTYTAGIPAGCKEKVDHLVETKWNQDDPYWDKCPEDGTGKHCYTGCVATAMAQIMRYYKYPTKGKGNASILYNGKSYEVNFAAGRGYDYDNMLATYNSTCTTTQKLAVATLMYHCGVAAKMTYGTNGSGAWLYDAADALYQHFGYTAKYYGYRDDLSDNLKNTVWREVIYQELSDGHPILYAGTSNKNGNEKQSVHAFVLDGYDKDGNVGVNWGYGGGGDGYFSLDILSLKYGYDEEYKWWQNMVIIHTPEAGPINNGLTGIEGITAPRPTDGKKYDLSGREITTPVKGTVYIENGKKHLCQ